MNDEERKAAGNRLHRQFKALSSGLGIEAVQKATLGLSTSGVFVDMAHQAENLRRIIDPVGLRGIGPGMDLATLGFSRSILDSLGIDSPLARLASDMERQSKIFGSLPLGVDRQFRLVPGILRDFESSYALGTTRALDLPRIGSALIGYKPPAPEAVIWPAPPRGSPPPSAPAMAEKPIMH